MAHCEPPHYMDLKRTFLASKEPTFSLVGFRRLCLPDEEQLILRNDFYKINQSGDDTIEPGGVFESLGSKSNSIHVINYLGTYDELT